MAASHVHQIERKKTEFKHLKTNEEDSFTDFVSHETPHKMTGVDQDYLTHIKSRKIKYFGQITQKTEDIFNLLCIAISTSLFFEILR